MQHTARTTEGKLRQRVHSLVRENGFTEDEYRDRLEQLTGYRYARLCNETQLEYAVEVFEQLRPTLPDYSDAELAATVDADDIESLWA